MIGPFINASTVILGTVLGASLSTRIPERIRTTMPMFFGLVSAAMGIPMIAQVSHLPAMVLSVLIGTCIGEIIYLEKKIGALGSWINQKMSRFSSASNGMSKEVFLQQFVSILILFCFSGTGIFGAMNEGMTGDYSILIAKSFLDFFTASIFAVTLGYVIATIAVPLLIVQLILAYSAAIILPLTSPDMISDFKAVGGIVMFATGLRICGIKQFPIANMLPALVLTMPISALWTHFFH